MVQLQRQVQDVRPGAGLVPAASRDEVHLLRLGPHGRAVMILVRTPMCAALAGRLSQIAGMCRSEARAR